VTLALDRKSVLVGVGITTVALIATLTVASAGNASWWPFDHSDKATTVTLKGELNCSEVLGDGFGASPAAFTISAGSNSGSWTYPFKLGAGSIYHRPTFESYQFDVTIPKNQDKTRVSWSLRCWDQAGTQGAVTSDSFDVGRNDTTVVRTICYKTGGISFCPGSKFETIALNCLVGAVVPGEALELVDAAELVKGDKKTTYETVIGRMIPEKYRRAFGIVLACGAEDAFAQPPPATAKPIPTMPAPTAKAVPTLPAAPTTGAPARTTGAPAPRTGAAAPTTGAPAPQPVNRTAVVSYNRMAGGAPYWGRSTKGWQAFTAASNTMTQIGVTWSDTNYGPGATLSGVTTRISLCQGVGNPSSADPCAGRLADGYATVVNQGDTRIDLGDVAVTPGTTYYVFYYQPSVGAGSWDLYWWSCSCPPGRNSSLQSDQNQLIVLGYNR
jgi:hypothetical protein